MAVAVSRDGGRVIENILLLEGDYFILVTRKDEWFVVARDFWGNRHETTTREGLTPVGFQTEASEPQDW